MRRAGGRYVLGDLLGRGGMAEVFSGYSLGDHGFQKPVAIKRLLPELANDEVFVERLISEAKLLVGMQHGNVVSVLDLCRDGDDVFLVMEFVDGPSLRQLLKSRGQRGLPLGVATYIVQAAAGGLEFAHNRPGGAIIHADVSPSNILLTTPGEVRVADFGIARREGGGYGIVEGKWAYMAPEQARGEGLTPRSDVFALGVVLYELICGAHPFGRQVTAQERDNEPMRVIPPRVVRPTIPPGIDAICMKALAHDPRDRYARMQQLIDAIVEERFANQWREGASDLAHAIREGNPQSSAIAPRTMVTERPVTIATRSLLKEVTPARGSAPAGRASSSPRNAPRRGESHSRPSLGEDSQSHSESYVSESYVSESYVSMSRAARGTSVPPGIAPSDSIARTNAMLAGDVMRAAAMMELPPLLRADGTPLPPFKLSEALAPGQDLASVIGGHTISQHVPVSSIDGRGAGRWTIGVLLVAAVIGAIAAFTIARHNGDDTDPSLDPVFNPPVYQQQVVMPEGPDKPPAIKVDDDPGAEPSTPSTPSTPGTPATPTGTPGTPIGTPGTAGTPTTPGTPTNPPGTPTTPSTPTNPPGTQDPPPVDPPVDPPSHPRSPPVKKADGILRVNSEPWSFVTVAGQRQSTVAKFTLPPGRYTVVFENKEIGRKISKQVVVLSGKVVKLTANLEEDL